MKGSSSVWLCSSVCACACVHKCDGHCDALWEVKLDFKTVAFSNVGNSTVIQPSCAMGFARHGSSTKQSSLKLPALTLMCALFAGRFVLFEHHGIVNGEKYVSLYPWLVCGPMISVTIHIADISQCKNLLTVSGSPLSNRTFLGFTFQSPMCTHPCSQGEKNFENCNPGFSPRKRKLESVGTQGLGCLCSVYWLMHTAIPIFEKSYMLSVCELVDCLPEVIALDTNCKLLLFVCEMAYL